MATVVDTFERWTGHEPSHIGDLLKDVTTSTGTRVTAPLKKAPRYWTIDERGRVVARPHVELPDGCA